jgi:hypothetical protein
VQDSSPPVARGVPQFSINLLHYNLVREFETFTAQNIAHAEGATARRMSLEASRTAGRAFSLRWSRGAETSPC